MKPYIGMLGRSSYDVFPNGDFLMLAAARFDSAARSVPLVVRTNWAASLGDRLGSHRQ
jgi:hypothetical protein